MKRTKWHPLERSLLPLSCLVLVAGSPAMAQDRSAAEEALYQTILSDVEFSARPIRHPDVMHCFRGDFYEVTLGMRYGSYSSMNAGATYVLLEDEVKSVDLPGGEGDIPELTGLVNEGCRLQNEEEGGRLMAALIALYAIQFDEVGPEVFRSADKQWSFITDDFFDDFIGFVVTTDDAGNITNIQYSLSIQRPEN